MNKKELHRLKKNIEAIAKAGAAAEDLAKAFRRVAKSLIAARDFLDRFTEPLKEEKG